MAEEDEDLREKVLVTDVKWEGVTKEVRLYVVYRSEEGVDDSGGM